MKTKYQKNLERYGEMAEQFPMEYLFQKVEEYKEKLIIRKILNLNFYTPSKIKAFKKEFEERRSLLSLI